MLTIRRAQIDALARPFTSGRVDRALKHLRNCIPQVCATRSEDDLRAIITWAEQRVERYGIDREVDFFRYLNLMFMFGFEFDTDRRYPWAADVLASNKRSRAKVDLLMDHAMLFLSRTVTTDEKTA